MHDLSGSLSRESMKPNFVLYVPIKSNYVADGEAGREESPTREVSREQTFKVDKLVASPKMYPLNSVAPDKEVVC